jgi:hypothetical protein
MSTHSAAGPRPVTTTQQPTLPRAERVSLLIFQALVALSAALGGAALVVGSLAPQLSTVLSPPAEYLAGSPFSSYLVPGLVLALVVGGTQAVAFVLGITRHDLTLPAAAVAAIGLLIWVFVQMVFIPFSFLQAIYFLVAIAETCLVLLMLGILRHPARPTR